MRAEQEKERIEKAQSVLHRLADGQKHRVPDLWQGGPVVEWQLRFLKRLQRESMVLQQGDGFQATGRMVPLLKAASANVPAVVELLWPERAKDVLKGLTKLAPVALPEPEPKPASTFADIEDPEAFRMVVVRWIAVREPGRWYRVKELLPLVAGTALFPRSADAWVRTNVEPEQWNLLGRILSGGSRRLQVVEGWIVERRNGVQNSTAYRLIQKAIAPTAPAPAPVVVEPEPQRVEAPPVPVKSAVQLVVEAVVAALRQHGPLPKRELQDRVGGKRQNAADAIETALREGACFFGHVPGHVRARMYLQEQLDAAEAAHAQVPQDDDGHETDVDVATATDDTVDDETFKATVLKYTLIYGQNFITLGEHLRVMHETTALLHETVARLEEKLDAILEKKS